MNQKSWGDTHFYGLNEVITIFAKASIRSLMFCIVNAPVMYL